MDNTVKIWSMKGMEKEICLLLLVLGRMVLSFIDGCSCSSYELYFTFKTKLITANLTVTDGNALMTCRILEIC